MDAEARAREIVDEAKRARKPTPRSVWVAALVLAVVCVVALAIGWLTAGPASPEARSPRPEAPVSSGFGTGLFVGLAAGIAIGTAIGLRRRGARRAESARHPDAP